MCGCSTASNIHDDHTVEMKFKEPPLGLLYELTYTRPVRYLSPTSVAADGSYRIPIGTGPWRQVAGRQRRERLRASSTDYWGEKPQFERLELKVLPDSRSRMAALRAGEIDVTGGDFFAPITATEAETLKDAGIRGRRRARASPCSWASIRTAPRRSPTSKVRKAISMGFDRAAIAQVLYQGSRRAGGQHVPAVACRCRARSSRSTNATSDAARALLEEAGWTGEGIREKDGKPLSLELVVSEEQIAGSRSMAEVMQAQLGEIGVDLKIRSVDHASRHSDIPARKYDLAFFLTFGAPYEPFGTMVGYLVSTYDNGVDGKLVVDPGTPRSADEDGHDRLRTRRTRRRRCRRSSTGCTQKRRSLPMLYSPSIWAHTDRVDGFQAPVTEYDTPYEGLHVETGLR